MYKLKITEEVSELGHKIEYEFFSTLDDNVTREEIKNAIKEKKETITIKNAYGERDPSLVQMVPLSILKNNGINPIPGMVLKFGELQGIVKTISGGRVVVDFNHPLAGKEVKFKIKIEKEYNSKKEFLEDLLNFLKKIKDFEELAKNLVIEENRVILKDEKFKKLLEDLLKNYGLNIEITVVKDNQEEKKEN